VREKARTHERESSHHPHHQNPLQPPSSNICCEHRSHLRSHRETRRSRQKRYGTNARAPSVAPEMVDTHTVTQRRSTLRRNPTKDNALLATNLLAFEAPEDACPPCKAACKQVQACQKSLQDIQRRETVLTTACKRVSPEARGCASLHDPPLWIPPPETPSPGVAVKSFRSLWTPRTWTQVRETPFASSLKFKLPRPTHFTNKQS